jgi:hypothetical protein
MTVKLNSNFLSNAGGFTLLDSASVTWAINPANFTYPTRNLAV